MVVVVTGASGQLGQALQALAPQHEAIQFYFVTSAEADITNKENLEQVFSRLKPDFCINAAAYTAVDKAESEPEKAHLVNVTGAKNLAEVCKEYNTTLIHVSTDFVFDGSKNTPYTEEDETNPQGVYGKTKREGEQEIEKLLTAHYIIRTSWLYSEYGNNFMKTMIRLGNERDSLGVVNDQTGTPTNANDLAEAILQITESGKKEYGIYHYSNEGVATWYEFAKKIFEVNNISVDLKPITTQEYPTPARRPAYSVMDKSKIKRVFGITIKHWQDNL
ncbi:dTDP-4-dehydrorhamnose reductase [Flavobacterium salilacus subsp. salilacus]|uniref:dTDP-4-dehydrorhamnose reductase n=1 Tax=Flavobacterium TaxID=237 RepID=UPI0010752033|nr:MULTISPECIES: dTDP-4-dehydrorhamnose reductase [Flavobacterium]KAF2518989.1 dTDP-4-dehydrorhamnose reductase [Flavobacterium salilacus subsp. salilacus]MBE1614848.1 dTDP-4-dehydrorhamnose reductase [Flavobacterium sp. SaA2.13]